MATHAHFVKKARKDYPDAGIKKGDSYWWWAFKFGPEHKSLTQPRPSQLTQSEFMSTYLGIGETLDDALNAATCKDDVESAVDDAKSSIEELRDEQQSKKDNMPEQLQETGSGEILQERYDQLDQWYNDLDGVNYGDLEQAESDRDEKEAEEAAKEEKPLEVGDVVTIVKDDAGYEGSTGTIEAIPSPRNADAVMVRVKGLDVSIDFEATNLKVERDEDDEAEDLQQEDQDLDDAVETALQSLKDEITALDPGIS